MTAQELLTELSNRCSQTLELGRAFFEQANADANAGHGYRSSVREEFSEETLAKGEALRGEVRDLTARLINAAKRSPLIGREDINDATTAMKTALAALRVKSYHRWDTHVLHDEDIVLGVVEAGQTEQDTDLRSAIELFEQAIQKLTDFTALLVPGQSATVIGEDAEFARMAVNEARKSTSEDSRARPLVGAVVVKDGRVLATAYRGEFEANHAEYIALEKKLEGVSIAGSTVYTTLEPCTTRNHPKLPCADRLVERKVARVVIGMLDPNPDIRGRGMWRLQEANIIVEMFPHELMNEIKELNREFIRSFPDAGKSAAKTPEGEDRGVVLAKRKLFNLLRKINCIECNFEFPPGPTGASFNGGTIKLINADLDRMQDAIIELSDLPEARTLFGARIPETLDAPWGLYADTYRKYFLPIQTLFATLKVEVLGIRDC